MSLILRTDMHIPNPEAWCSYEAFSRICALQDGHKRLREALEFLQDENAKQGIYFQADYIKRVLAEQEVGRK